MAIRKNDDGTTTYTGKDRGPKLKKGQRATYTKKSGWRAYDVRAPKMTGAGPRRDKKLREAEEKAVGKKK